jgi:hypothetical protein
LEYPDSVGGEANVPSTIDRIESSTIDAKTKFNKITAQSVKELPGQAGSRQS